MGKETKNGSKLKKNANTENRNYRKRVKVCIMDCRPKFGPVIQV